MNLTQRLPRPRVQLGPKVRNDVEARLPRVPALRTIQINLDVSLRIGFADSCNRQLNNFRRHLTRTLDNSLVNNAYDALLKQARAHLGDRRTIRQLQEIDTVGKAQLEVVTRVLEIERRAR